VKGRPGSSVLAALGAHSAHLTVSSSASDSGTLMTTSPAFRSLLANTPRGQVGHARPTTAPGCEGGGGGGGGVGRRDSAGGFLGLQVPLPLLGFVSWTGGRPLTRLAPLATAHSSSACVAWSAGRTRDRGPAPQAASAAPRASSRGATQRRAAPPLPPPCEDDALRRAMRLCAAGWCSRGGGRSPIHLHPPPNCLDPICR
jgi:hypothetical protein